MNIPEVNDKFLAQLIASLHTERTGNKNQIGSTRKVVESLMQDILTALSEVSALGEATSDSKAKALFDVIENTCQSLHKSPDYMLSVAKDALGEAYENGKIA